MLPSPYWKDLFTVNVVLAALLSFTVGQSSSSPVDIISNPFHASWNVNKTDGIARFDFIYNLVTPFKNDFKIESIAPASLVSCVGYSACLLKNGQFLQAFEPHLLIADTNPHKLLFAGIVNKPLNSSVPTCDLSNITVYHYCSTHWNPPTHIVGDGLCKHTFEWHSPYSCDKNNTNYEHPCYTYDNKGGLVDLTRWVISNGSSYSVDTGAFNATIKEFNLNVCNEAHEACGPNVSSCYIGTSGQIESGFNNLTSLKYDAKEKTAILTSLGQFNLLCPDQRVRTVVRFSCKDKIISNTMPKLIGSTACENTIEWQTVHACPISEIQKPSTECAIKNEALGIDINLKRIMNNATSIEVPITVEGKEKKMVLGLCRGINAKYLKCEGKATSATSACLLDTNVNSTVKNSTNSQIVGSITNSIIRLTDNQVYLESFATNKSCQVPLGRNFSSINRVGTRIEFFCSPQTASKPAYIGYQDCIHVFEWGSRAICLETMSNGIIDSINLKNTSLPLNTTNIAKTTSTETKTNLSDDELKINMNPKPQTAKEMHQTTVNDARTIIDSNATDQLSKKDSATNVQVVDKSSKEQAAPIASHHNAADEPKINLLPEQDTKMNKWHKFFMISLIILSLAGFIVIMFILDNKTRLGFPLSNLRRQARQAFQPQPVPYSRVDDFNNHLDL